MDYLPPGCVVKVGDPRWKRWIIKDAEGRCWTGGGRWSDDPSESLLFNRELDAAKQKNRWCLRGDPADTFTVTVVVTVHPGRWSRKELARFLARHREFFRGGPPGKEGLLLEIVPDTLRKTKP
jgi:hypothetical protein